MLQNVNISQTKRVSATENWLGRQGLQVLKTLLQVGQEACNEEEGLIEILNNKFRL